MMVGIIDLFHFICISMTLAVSISTVYHALKRIGRGSSGDRRHRCLPWVNNDVAKHG